MRNLGGEGLRIIDTHKQSKGIASILFHSSMKKIREKIRVFAPQWSQLNRGHSHITTHKTLFKSDENTKNTGNWRLKWCEGSGELKVERFSIPKRYM